MCRLVEIIPTYDQRIIGGSKNKEYFHIISEFLGNE